MPRNVGAPWTLEEEKRLYEETVKSMSVAEIAAVHGRTTGGVKARQRQMGLRDEAGKLISPLPEFQSALREKNKREATPLVERKRRSKRPSSAVLRAAGGARQKAPAAEPEALAAWPKGFPHYGDWIEKLWNALRHDTEVLLRNGRQPGAAAERGINITLARLTPDDKLHPAAKLSELGDAFGVSRERIRQIQVKTMRRLAARVQQTDSLTGRVLDMMAETPPRDHMQAPLSWFANELAGRGCRTAFTEFMLLAFLVHSGATPKDARQRVEEAMGAIVTLRRAKASASRRRRQDDEVTERTRRANAFVLGILRQAAWPERLNGRSVDLSGVRPLRDCKYDQPYYSRTLQRLVGYDSMGERRLIQELDLCTIVTEFVEQPMEIGYRFDGKDRVYVPDLLVRIDANLFFIIEIKGRHRLADRKTLAKAEAAGLYLGERGIGYCLADAGGFGLDDLRALEPDENFNGRLEDLLQRYGMVRRDTFEQAFGPGRRRWAYDQLQAAVLRDGLSYDTRLIERPDFPHRYIFDFRLSRTAGSLP